MIRGQTTKLKDEFRCLSPDCSGPLCVSVSFVVSVRENQDVLPGQKLERALKFEPERFKF